MFVSRQCFLATTSALLLSSTSRAFAPTSSTAAVSASSSSLCLLKNNIRLANTNNNRSIIITMMSSSSSAVATSDDIPIAENLQDVRNRIAAACETHNRPIDSVRLVAVSKTKPLTMLQAARTAADQLVFGENYVQELIDKVQHVNNAEENFVGGKDIQWHFIGALQSNKVNALIHAFENRMDKLVVETVGSQKLANKLNTAVAAATTNTDDTTTTGGTKLKVFVQVNTSGEDSKSGVKPNDEVVELCRHIYTSCPHLMLQGLMTIGAPGDESAFDVLSECRTRVSEALLMDLSDEETEEHAALELSMGMSDDFEVAIAKGSTNVRVGSTIFGARNYANK